VNVPLVALDCARSAKPERRRTVRDPQVREAVRAILASHSPLRKPLTAKHINAILPAHLRRSDQDIRHHMRGVWSES
jgi:hypothetical protein